ncbi:glycoside hydrolase family 81 protein [Gongronella butleri]|nr:glycoside hydrolase family 81 protein [Gongronella butleri]
MRPKTLFTHCAAVCTTFSAVMASYGPSDHPISTDAPKLPGGSQATDVTPGPFFQDFSPPFPTDSWWVGFGVPNQTDVVAGPFPFQCATLSSGLTFGLSDDRYFDGTSIHVDTQLDWTMGITGLPDGMNNRKATYWDTQAVCLRYFVGSGTMNTCLVQGSPYMTFEFNNAPVTLASANGPIQNFEWTTQGTKARMQNNGGTYLLYASGNAIDLQQNGNALVTSDAYTGVLRMAKLNSTSQEAILDAHAGIYAKGVTLSYDVSGSSATLTWKYNTTQLAGGSGDLLMLSWPHHRNAFVGNPSYVSDLTYLTVKGQMIGVAGDRWSMTHALHNVSWFASQDPDASCMAELKQLLAQDVGQFTAPIANEMYLWGGTVARAAQLATIADHLGETQLRDQVLAQLKITYDQWFNVSRSPIVAYESAWGGVIDIGADNGVQWYNDHHFLYGYFLHGAAVIAKYDADWLQQHKDVVTAFARDIGNPSPLDPYFTVSRHMDWFHGHSWASGIANSAGSRDQESSTEAINGYYGLTLWAEVLGDQDFLDYARLLLSIEITGAQTYWHLYPDADPKDINNPYPEQAFRALTTVGNVQDYQAGAFIFWGGLRTQIAGIQVLPVTPIGEITYDKAWMQGVLPYCQSEIDDQTIGTPFKAVIYAAYAAVDPKKAYELTKTVTDFGSGQSHTNQLYFISTQQPNLSICS